MYCTNCGKKIPDGSKFCRYCGIAVRRKNGGMGSFFRRYWRFFIVGCFVVLSGTFLFHWLTGPKYTLADGYQRMTNSERIHVSLHLESVNGVNLLDDEIWLFRDKHRLIQKIIDGRIIQAGYTFSDDSRVGYYNSEEKQLSAWSTRESSLRPLFFKERQEMNVAIPLFYRLLSRYNIHFVHENEDQIDIDGTTDIAGFDWSEQKKRPEAYEKSVSALKLLLEAMQKKNIVSLLGRMDQKTEKFFTTEVLPDGSRLKRAPFYSVLDALLLDNEGLSALKKNCAANIDKMLDVRKYQLLQDQLVREWKENRNFLLSLQNENTWIVEVRFGSDGTLRSLTMREDTKEKNMEGPNITLRFDQEIGAIQPMLKALNAEKDPSEDTGMVPEREELPELTNLYWFFQWYFPDALLP